jgi:hypothetical protein
MVVTRRGSRIFYTSGLQPGVRENILHQSKRMNLKPVLILALTKIRPRTEVVQRQKQAQPSH